MREGKMDHLFTNAETVGKSLGQESWLERKGGD